MSQKLIRGRNVTCDRCDVMEFLTEGQLDAGNHNWSRIVSHEKKMVDLCPSCTDIYQTMIENFMGEVKTEKIIDALCEVGNVNVVSPEELRSAISMKFKIGDQVKVIKICDDSDGYDAAEKYIGKTGTVIDYVPYSPVDMGYDIAFHDGSFNGHNGNRWVWADEELEIVVYGGTDE